MEQYTRLAHRIMDNGKWFEVGRNGAKALTVISDRFEYDCRDRKIELPSTAWTNFPWAVAELLGYIRGYRSAADFRKLGTKTWDANANKNESWLNNNAREGEDDMGIVYGAVGNHWPKMSQHARGCNLEYHGEEIDLLDKIYNNLKNGIDDRGETWTFWNPGVFEFGCLRPCLHTHQFSLLDGELYIDSTQRSVDVPLGLKFNMVQVQVLLQVMAQITGHKVANAAHNMVNCHIYANQVDTMRDVQLKREDTPHDVRLWINPEIKTLEDLRTWVTTDDFRLEGYEPQPFVRYGFTE